MTNTMISLNGDAFTLRVTTYPTGGTCVHLEDEEGPYTTLSINIPGTSERLERGEFVLNHDLNEHQVVADMVKKGLIEKTTKTADYGFVRAQPVYKLTLEDKHE